MIADPTASPAEQHWNDTLADLQRQMTKATFESWFENTVVISAGDGLYTIAAHSQVAQDWLENRLKETAQRALAKVTGRPDIQISFIYLPSSLQEVEPRTEADWSSVPSEFLDFNPYAVGGYFASSNYITRFWTAHLGATAMQLMDYIRSFYQEPAFIYDKKARQNIPNPNWQPWTPARDFHLNDLVRALKATDKQIRGCWRTCHVYGDEVAQGVVNDHCFCHLRAGAGELALGKPTPAHPDGKPICHFRRPGLLDLLQAEEIATVQQLGDPANPATVYFKIQVYQPLPLLTPWQIAQFASAIQDGHRKWLSGHGFNLAAWGAIPVERMMSLVKIYPKWLR